MQSKTVLRVAAVILLALGAAGCGTKGAAGSGVGGSAAPSSGGTLKLVANGLSVN